MAIESNKARKKREQREREAAKKQGTTSNGNQGSSIFQNIDDNVLQVAEVLGADSPEIPSEPHPPHASIDSEAINKLNAYTADLDRFLRDAKESIRKYEASRKRYEELQSDLNKKIDDLKTEKEAFVNSKEEFEATTLEFENEKKEYDKKNKDLETREKNAKEKFRKQNEEVLAETKEQLAELRVKKIDLTKELDDLRESAIAKLDEELSCRREELRNRELDLNTRLSSLEVKEQKLHRDTSRLEMLFKDLDEERKQIHEDAHQAVQVELDKLQLKLVTAQNQRDKAYNELADREKQLTEFDDIRRELKGRNIVEFLESYDRLKQDLRECRLELEGTGGTDYITENTRLRHECDALKERIRILESNEVHTLTELHTSRVNILDKERLEAEKRALLQHKQLLNAHLKELESKVSSLAKAHQAEKVFPELSKMDEYPEFTSETKTSPVPKLNQFVQDLRHRLAKSEDVELHYEIEDICLFMGGLAMSQLHIYEGMSGTGKTSLVKAFAKAVGGYCTDISVQAGWRDKHDIIGHYNTFEKKYYEKECLQALYRSQVPSYADRINVVLLDEMNLSRPEQYFAEFLSAIEKNDPNERLIELREEALPQTPNLFVKSRWVRIPKNIWFMGTANHDETTNEFADKTQDRAFVMELSESNPFDIIPPDKPMIYSYKSLRHRFEEAAKSHAGEINDILARLKSRDCKLKRVLNESFDVNWGKRFAIHALTFIPVVMECSGGSPERALDHLFASRLFRKGKVTDRYDIKLDKLKEVEDALLQFWSGFQGLPEKCINLIDKDRKRKERRGES